MEILKAEQIRKSFDGNEVLKGISISVNEGEVLAIIGPSGSGKSTFLSCVTQLETVDSGTILLCGDTLVKNGPDGKAVYADKTTCSRIGLRIGLVFQNFNLFPHFSVMRNITEAPVRVLGKKREEAEATARNLLKKMNLADKADAHPSELSGGQKQRVAIARALMMDPDMLLFDEPTSSLDPQLTAEVLAVIKELAKGKMTMIIVTHEMGFAREVADKVLFMGEGRVIEQGPPQELFGSPNDQRVKDFIQSIL